MDRQTFRQGRDGVTSIGITFRRPDSSPIQLPGIVGFEREPLYTPTPNVPQRLWVRITDSAMFYLAHRIADRHLLGTSVEVTAIISKEGQEDTILWFLPCRLVKLSAPGRDFTGLIFVCDSLAMAPNWRNPFDPLPAEQKETPEATVDRLDAESARRGDSFRDVCDALLASQAAQQVLETESRLLKGELAKLNGEVSKLNRLVCMIKLGRDADERKIAEDAKVIDSLGERLKAALASPFVIPFVPVLTPYLMREAGRAMAEMVELRRHHIRGIGPDVDVAAEVRLLAGMIRLLAGYMAAEMEVSPSDPGQVPGPRAERSAEQSEVPPPVGVGLGR